MPWEANPQAVRAYRPPLKQGTAHGSAGAASTTEARPVLFHFAGALDVCCTGAAIRCAMGPLAATTLRMPDVIVRFLVPANRSVMKPCTRKAVEMLEALPPGGETHDSRSLRLAAAPLPLERSHGHRASERGEAPAAGQAPAWRSVGSSVFDRTARGAHRHAQP